MNRFCEIEDKIKVKGPVLCFRFSVQDKGKGKGPLAEAENRKQKTVSTRTRDNNMIKSRQP
jgi:hypothetical protein